MPLPAVPIGWIIIAIGGAVIAGFTVRQIYRTYYGKRLAVLGERETGKSHLLKFLTTGSIPKEYFQTPGREKVSSRWFEMADLRLKVFVNNTYDVSGSADARAEWKKVVDDAEFLLYLFRADRLDEGSAATEQRIKSDARHISDWLKDSGRTIPVVLVGTHCDNIARFRRLKDKTCGGFRDEFARNDAVDEARRRMGGLSNVKLVLGSMKDIDGTRRLAAQALVEAKKAKEGK